MLAARERQLARAGTTNARLRPEELRRDCRLGTAEAQLLERASEKLELSVRACDRVLKVARSIADLSGGERIDEQHLLEAIGYRLVHRP